MHQYAFIYSKRMGEKSLLLIVYPTELTMT